MPATPKFKKIEGESYLYELTYPSGTKGYAVRATRAGVPGKKQYFPFPDQKRQQDFDQVF